MKILSLNGITPSVLCNDSRIILIEVQQIGVRFLSSNNYLKGNVYEMGTQFDILFNINYLPKHFLQKCNLSYIGTIPPKEYFITEFDTDHERSQKEKFITDFGLKTWNFRKELITFSQQKLFLLTISYLKFLNEFFCFQKLMKCTQYLNPFNPKLVTIGGAFYKLYKLLYLSKYPLYTVMNEYGVKTKHVSRIEHQYLCYLEATEYLNEPLLTAFNNPNGQKYFPEAIPDGYSPTKKKAIFVQGCWWHKCGKPEHNFSVESVAKAKLEFEQKTSQLLINHPEEVDEIVIAWECDIKSDINFKIFVDTNYITRPLHRLVPRDCYKGAFHDNYHLKWSQTENCDEQLLYFDINGLYSYVAIKNKFMINKYITLIGKTLDNIEIKDNRFLFKGANVMGAIFLTILPPNDLFYPFLMYRSKNGQLFNTLCSLCSELQLNICKHSDKERAITGCYMISEIEYCLSLNYKILQLYECHIYVDHDFILREYVQKLTFMKTVSSNCFENINDYTAKSNYCKTLNDQMDFCDDFALTPENVKPNSSKRFFYKLAQNSFFGKFGQRIDKNKLVFCTDQEQLENIVKEQNSINDVYTITENCCAISYKPNSMSFNPSLKTNVHIAAQITAFAREVIHKHVLNLSSVQGIKLFQADCDSVIFSLPLSERCPLSLSHAVGDFKNEINGTILNYFSLGPKNYIISYKTNTNEIKFINKISGLSLESSKICPELYESFLTKLRNDIEAVLIVPNRKRKFDMKKLDVSMITQNFSLTNQIKLKRILDKNSMDFSTVPYGFKK